MTIALTLFFVLIAFFAATSLLARSHFEAQATIMDTASIQREALARSALASGLAILESAGTEETFTDFSLAGPGGMEARVWLEHEDDDIFRLFAEVKGGMGRPYVAQKVLRKKPRLTAIDMAHLVDGQLTTADSLKYRVVGSDDWVSLPNGKSSLMWVEVDRRGNVVSNYFPVLETGQSAALPDGFIERLIEKNDEYVNDGNIEHGFLRKASIAIEENQQLNLNRPLQVGVNMGNAGNAGNNGGGGLEVQLETNPDFIRPAREVADAITVGAAIEHYSQESGQWNTITLDLSGEPSGVIPGAATSDGKGVYFPIIKPGEDSLRRFDFESESWEELSPPPALSGGGKTHHLIEVKVDDDGRIYAHHGDDGQYGISMYDPEKDAWKRLPDPKGIYVDQIGREKVVSENISEWGNLEVDDQGNVYVIWRAKGDTAVTNHLANSSQTFVPGSGDGFVTGQFESPDIQGAYNSKGSNPAYGSSVNTGGGYGGTGNPGSKGNAAAVASNITKPPSSNSGSMVGGMEIPTNTTLPENPGTGNPGSAGNTGTSVPWRPPGGLPGYYEQSVDMVLKLSDGEWSAIRPPLAWGESLGGISAGVDGRLLIHILNPKDDTIYVIRADGTREAPSKVPDDSGDPALYFSADSGARTVAGKYSFQETAEY